MPRAVWMCARVCARVHMQAHTHTLTLAYMLPASAEICRRLHVSSFGMYAVLPLFSQADLPSVATLGKAVKFPCAVFSPFLLKVQKSHAQPAGILETAWGLIFGSTCDRASFASCPVVMSVSFVCEIVHAYTHTGTLTRLHTPSS